MESERRKEKRRKFTYYMRVVDANTLDAIGYLTEISAIGIQVDCEKPFPVGRNYKLRLDLTPDIADKNNMMINGTIKWCQPDKLNATGYNVGFEVSITAKDDTEIFQRMIDMYGLESRR
ncbi:MAG: PilZ domain-containing protein [Anaerolineales bacterium]|nr:PilZ domain-containing protein [Anaerolineales bacterium]